MKKIGAGVLCLAMMASVVLPSFALDVKGGLKGAVGSVAPKATEDGSKAIKDQVDAVIKKSDKITTDFQAALINVNTLLGLKSKTEEIKADQKGSAKGKKNSEVNSLEAQMADLNAALADAEKQKEVVANLKALSADKQLEFAKCVENMAIGALGYADVAMESANLVTAMASDPASAMKLGAKLKELKKVATNAPGQAKAFGGTVKGLFQVATQAGIKVKKPEAKTSKTKKTTDF